MTAKKIATAPLTSLGAAAAAVIDGLRPVPPGIEIIPCAEDALWRAARAQDVTASTLGALLGCHEYVTPYELYCMKAGALQEPAETPAMRRGRVMEHAAVQLLRIERPEWIVRHNDGAGRLYYRDPVARLGATPDVIATLPDGQTMTIQIKSVAARTFREKWIVDGEPLPPQWIILQGLAERDLTGSDLCAVAPIVLDGFGGLEMPIIEVPLGKAGAIMSRARKEVADFWRRVADANPPAPDFGKDGGVISSIYADDDGGEISLADNTRIMEIMVARDELKKREADGRDAEKARKIYDAEIIHMLGNAARGRLADGRVIEAKTVSRSGFEVKPTTFRTIKIKESR